MNVAQTSRQSGSDLAGQTGILPVFFVPIITDKGKMTMNGYIPLATPFC